MLGASIENPAHGQGLEEGVLEKSKAEIRPQVYPLDFPEHLPPKTRVCLAYCTVLSILLT